MRLLNTKTFKLKEFQVDIPPYAILSHTWDEEEVTFQDIRATFVAKRKAGWSKVKNACAYALKHEFEWIWIDSCCIDKSSSAELSEAINSMYQYYEDAVVCYAYLSDASSKEDPRDVNSGFRRSKWFKRGWTLQELLAPAYLVILDQKWIEIGTRWSLRDAISAITSIPIQVFEGRPIYEYSVAQKMSWAAFRQTTRPEDEAYCLMGIFGVNMPPIYGEGGAKAFMRLQQEIIRISEDRSIFAWVSSPEESSDLRGLFAKSPREFRASGVVEKCDSMEDFESSFSFNNNGLHIHLPIMLLNDSNASVDTDHVFLASLDCQAKRDGSRLFIYLQKISGKRYVRCRPDEILLMSSVSGELTPTEVVVQENSFSHSKQKKWTSLDPEVGFIMYPIKVLSSARHALTFVGCEDKFGRSAFLDRNRMSLNLSTYLEVLQILTYRVQSTGEPFSVVIRSGEHGSNPSADIVTAISPSIWTNTSQATSPADRSLLRLQTEGLVSVSLQMMGQHSKRTIEIGYYHDTEEHDVAVRVLWPSSPGFIVPRLADNERILLQGVFPADFCGSVPDKGIEAYVSMPFHDEGCRLLTYSYTDYRSRHFKFYVALGLRKNGETWTDIFVYEDGRGIDQDELGVVWKDYCGSGAMGRVASANFNSRTLGTSISAVTEKSRTLQIGSHSLLLNFYSPG